ncbi:hypothetical protein [Pseudodesulfovibrio indicus]|uniref:Uncharacterized protein n=1 Tax=Pseudodesulfovibrio indicus TaxID=1716143 RepID=A0A126QRV3_9BACT|nr:hypothetical protein [Pseudodesulfovibrio indicus]AMK12469.1 hypothetical protein AWY79_15855 [Pseudodesulfovibrio indicus]TDT90773.1 hypothetical protein EDC59_102203 [Pseudodesulfovibrio indicus]
MTEERSVARQLMEESLDPFRILLGLLEWMPSDQQIPLCAFVDNLTTAIEAAERRVVVGADFIDHAALAMGINNQGKAEAPTEQ